MAVLLSKETGLLARPEFLDQQSPPELELFEIQFDGELPACHVSMEAQVFTPDSRFLLLHYGAGVQSFNRNTPGRGYFLCELETGVATPVAMERGAIAPVVSPDGQFIYYFIDTSYPGGGRVILMRRRLDGTEPTVLSVLDANLPGTTFRPSLPNPLSTISSDGSRLAISFFLGDGHHDGAPYGLVVFDLINGSSNLILHGPSWSNIHAQYSRSVDAAHRADILIQENHSGLSTADGRRKRGGGGWGADIHVIKDNGQHLRNLPWGRNGQEWCSGHQCWRGTTPWVIGSVVIGDTRALDEKNCELHLMESLPTEHWEHHGIAAPKGLRNRICRNFQPAHFNHMACDLSGQYLVADYRPSWDPEVVSEDAIYLMRLGEPGEDPALAVVRLLSPCSSWREVAHVHPFFSPDGKNILFNSDRTGVTRPYLLKHLPVI